MPGRAQAGSHSQDHRGAASPGGAQIVGSNTSIVYGSDIGDDSRRYRERQLSRALSTPTAYTPPRGTSP